MQEERDKMQCTVLKYQNEQFVTYLLLLIDNILKEAYILSSKINKTVR
jgi:hypothetical protein